MDDDPAYNPPTSRVKPIFLFADSQLLFWARGERTLLRSIVEMEGTNTCSAAYIGAANGDAPEFYSIFEAAMEAAGIVNCRMIASAFGPDDAEFLRRADVILIAGGNVEIGCAVLLSTGMDRVILERYRLGATLIGISAGAMQLGQYAIVEDADSTIRLLETLRLVPYVIDTNVDDRNGARLARVLQSLGENAKGILMSKGGGLIYHSDGNAEVIRHSPLEFIVMNGRLVPGPLSVMSYRKL